VTADQGQHQRSTATVETSTPRTPRTAEEIGRRLGRLMVLPLIVVLGAIFLYPVLFTARISLQDYRLNALADVRFIGLDHYISLLDNATFITAMRNTAVFVVVAVGLELVLGLTLALLVHRQVRLRNVTRSILLAPMFVTPIAVGLMFRFLLNQQLGLIPPLLDAVGIQIDFFGPRLALLSLAFIDVWQWTPLIFLMMLAGLESLPKQPFEAAKVDGASAWFTFRRVTLPMLRPAIVVAVIIRTLDALRVFEYVYAITRGGPGESTETIQFLIYRVGFQFFRLGEAAAMAYVLVAVVLLLVAFLARLTRRPAD
jgi:multiple sugar transport system permease protein